MSFRTREYYNESNWDETGIDIAFWYGFEKSDILIRLIIVLMILIDMYSLLYSIINNFTTLKLALLLLLSILIIFTLQLGPNLTIIHLEYKRMDVFKYKSLPLLKPIKLQERSYYLVDFKSASLTKSKFRLSPFATLKLKFLKPETTLKIPFRRDLPYRVHYDVYYKFKKKCSQKVDISIDALQKFYPFFNLKDNYREEEFRYLVLMTYFLTYFIFSLILPFIINQT